MIGRGPSTSLQLDKADAAVKSSICDQEKEKKVDGFLETDWGRRELCLGRIQEDKSRSLLKLERYISIID